MGWIRPISSLSALIWQGHGELYVEDARFAANYGGADNAAFVRDAMRVYAERKLS